MSVELKPCPFCGGKAETVHTRSGDDFVRCVDKSCHARTRNYHEAESLAVDAWNARYEQTCRFEPDGMMDDKLWHACSLCGGYVTTDYDTPDFCPHCGARVIA